MGACRDKRDHLVEQVTFVSLMAQHAVAWVGAFVVPALGVHAVHAECLEFALPVLVPYRVDHAAILVVVEASHRRRENNNGSPAMAKDEDFHVAAEARARPFVIFAIQSLRRAL